MDDGTHQQLGSYSNSYSFVGEYSAQDGSQDASFSIAVATPTRQPVQCVVPHTLAAKF